MPDEKVYEIDLNKKYVLIFPQDLNMSDLAHMRARINEWMKSGEPFLLISDVVKLVKVDDGEKVAILEPKPE